MIDTKQDNGNNESKMSSKIFISYSRKDLAAVEPIKDELERNGFPCWIDIDGIESGDENFKRKIVPALDKCKVVLFFISADSQKSEWTDKELGYAKRHGKRVVPLRFNDDPLVGAFDLDYGNADIIDWRRSEQKNKLIGDLRKWFASGSAPNMPSDMSSASNRMLPCKLATGTNASERAFGETLIQHLDQWLPWEYFRAAAGLEFSGNDGKVSLTAHAVGSPWGVFLIGFNDSIPEYASDTEVKIPAEEQMHACAEVTAKKCGLREHLVQYFFAVPEDLLRGRAKSFPQWVVSAADAVDKLKLFRNETTTVDWANRHRDITKCLEELSMSHSGREANIIKHFNARTVDEAEDGAALLAWAEDPSEALLDAAEKACLFLRENDGRGIAEGVLSWFRVMADRGNVIAMDHYGWLLDGGDEERVRWFRKAAERGGAHAQNSLGHCLQVGRGVPKDRVEALRWFRASAAQGNRFGQLSLANLMGFDADPAFLPQDWEEAFRLYRLSANQGWHFAQYHLGECYEKGLGVHKNLLEARRWYGEAAKNLNEDAQAALKRIESMLH